MSKIKPKRAHAEEIAESFCGIGSKGGSRALPAEEVRNFRILSDGSLKKRSGWSSLIAFPNILRGYYKGMVGETEVELAVAADTVYRITGSTRTAIGTLSNAAGRVCFFSYQERLYLLTGAALMVWHESTECFTEAIGYAPLYGQNWHPTDGGQVYEPFNLLGSHLRLHYFNTTGATVFTLPFYADSIDQVRIDGVLTSDYELLSPGNKLRVGAVGSSVEVAFSVSMSGVIREQLISSACAYREYDEGREHLILYGAPHGNLLFSAATVSENMFNASKAVYTDSDPLYFKNETVLTVGDRAHPITSLYRNHERVLAFHSAGAYSLSFAKEGDGIAIYPVLRDIGCTAKDSALYIDGDPVVINEGGIFRLHSPISEPDEFETVCLSEGLGLFPSVNFAQNAVVCQNSAHGELWFCDPTTVPQVVFVYRPLQKSWVKFDGFVPHFFFTDGCEIGFAYRNRLCRFSEALSTDDGNAFTAIYRSPVLDLSYPEDVKRALRVTLKAETHGNGILLDVRSEATSKTISLQGTEQDMPEFFDRRAAIGRFRQLRVSILDMGSASSRILRLGLFANL